MAFAVGDEQRAALEADFQFAAFEDAAVLIAENRQQHFVGELTFDRRPVDIENRA